jgi:hypothetical protein
LERSDESDVEGYHPPAVHSFLQFSTFVCD